MVSVEKEMGKPMAGGQGETVDSAAPTVPWEGQGAVRPPAGDGLPGRHLLLEKEDQKDHMGLQLSAFKFRKEKT